MSQLEETHIIQRIKRVHRTLCDFTYPIFCSQGIFKPASPLFRDSTVRTICTHTPLDRYLREITMLREQAFAVSCGHSGCRHLFETSFFRTYHFWNLYSSSVTRGGEPAYRFSHSSDCSRDCDEDLRLHIALFITTDSDISILLSREHKFTEIVYCAWNIIQSDENA